jgi:hypothetical protein
VTVFTDSQLSWVTKSSEALRIGRAVSALTNLGFLGALSVVVATLVDRRASSWAHWLLLPGIPVLIVGQLWAVAVQTARLRPLKTPGNRSKWRRRLSNRDVEQALLRGLPTWRLYLLYGLAVVATVIIEVSSPGFHGFHPSPPRFAATVFMMFYAFQAAISTAELARRREEQLARDRGF